MKLKFLLIATMAMLASTAFAQESGLKGRVLSRNGRTAVGNVAVTIEGTTYKAQTNDEGYFELKGVPAGDYKLSFAAPPGQERADQAGKPAGRQPDAEESHVSPAGTVRGYADDRQQDRAEGRLQLRVLVEPLKAAGSIRHTSGPMAMDSSAS